MRASDCRLTCMAWCYQRYVAVKLQSNEHVLWPQKQQKWNVGFLQTQKKLSGHKKTQENRTSCPPRRLYTTTLGYVQIHDSTAGMPTLYRW